MSLTLYRKYRPQKFADVHGQSGTITTLTNQITHERVAHAYIFAGMRGTGKTTTARLLAKALNCHTRATGVSEPCGECVSCVDIAAGHSIDVIELDAATHTGVDVVREHIIENARFLPTRDHYKIFIIDEVHMLSTSSFNALLKSLEEPPAHVIYILATTELHKIPATVVSRCQRYIFQPLPIALMEEKLRAIGRAEQVTIEDAVIRRIVIAAHGAMRDAESILGQLVALNVSHIGAAEADLVLPASLFHEAAAFIALLVSHDVHNATTMITDLHQAGIDLPFFHDALIAHAHHLLVAATTGTIPPSLGIFTDEERTTLQEAARTIDGVWLAELITRLLEKRPLYKSISTTTIPLHILVMESIAHTPMHEDTSPKSKPPTKPPTEPPPRAPAAGAPNSTIVSPEQLAEAWRAVIAEVVADSPSLGIIFSNATITHMTNNTTNVAVTFPLHRDRLCDATIKHRIENLLRERCNAPVTYCVTQEENVDEKNLPLVSELLEAFGGSVVA